MTKWIMILLIALWLCLIVITGVNIQRQYQLTKLQNRILSDYKLMSEVNGIFKDTLDSLQNDIKIAEKLRREAIKPFPLKDSYTNWLLLRISVVLLTLITIAVYWFYYKRKAQEGTG
jgi:hypothetical protein